MAVNSLLYFLLATGLTTPPEESVTTESNYDIVTRYNYGPTREEALYRTHRREITPGDFITTEYTTEDPHDEFVSLVTRGEEDSAFWPFNRKKPEHRTTERPEPPPHTKSDKDDRTPEGRTERPEPPPHTKSDRDDRTPEGRTERPEPPPHTKSEADSVFWPFHRKRPHRRTERPEPHTKSDRDYTTPEYRTERPEPPPHRKSEKEGVYWPHNNEEVTEQPANELGSFTCPQNEHYKRCGTVCPHTCYETKTCPSNCCVEGCFCNKGLVRGPAGNCIKPESCPSDSKLQKGKRPCPKREHMSSNCDKFCDKERNCSKQKMDKHCVCDAGLVRHENETCVNPEACGRKQISEVQNSGGCPLQVICDVECIRNGYEGGRCEGENCICIEKGKSVNSDCNIQECTIDCLTHGKGPGKCEGDTCKCYVESFSQDEYCPDESKCKEHCRLNGRDGTCEGGICMCWLGATEKGESVNSDCNLQECTTDCLTHGKGPGKCEGDTCKCYVESFSQDEYCANESKCKEHCLLNGRDGTCVGGICMCWSDATEPPQDSDSYYCHPSSCNKNCFAFGHGAGKCIGEKCKCERS